MRHSVFAYAIGIAALTTAGAQAADLRRPAPPPVAAPVMQQVFSWTGFYLGANLGWGWNSSSGTISMAGPAGTGPISGSGDGFLGGLQAGYNWQAGSLVFGVETDIQLSAASGNFSAAAGPNAVTGTVDAPWFGTIRARLGYAVDRWLLYVTGGAVYGETKMSGTVSPPPTAFSSTASYWTWTVGGGIETAVWDRWSLKAEYLYVGTPDSVPVPPRTVAISGNANSHIVRLGLNYHF